MGNIIFGIIAIGVGIALVIWFIKRETEKSKHEKWIWQKQNTYHKRRRY